MRGLFFVTVVTSFLSGCAGHVSDDIQSKYTNRVRELGLTPIYPPREEVQVGDIFVSSGYPGKEEHEVHQYVKNLPQLVALAQANLDSRVVFTETAASATAANSSDTAELRNGRIETRRQHASDSLPIAVFPEITADAGASLNFGILAPLRALGLFGGTRTTVTLNFNDVRTYFAPTLPAIAVAQREVCQMTQSGEGAAALAVIQKAAVEEDQGRLIPESLTRSGLKGREIVYRIVTRVYLTRSITYTYRNGQLLALAQSNLTKQDAGAAPPQPAPAITIVNITPANPAPATTDATSSQAQANEAIKALTAQNQRTDDGFQFAGFSALGLSINRTFKHPVAIAYEAIEIPALPAMAGLPCSSFTASVSNPRHSPSR
jgi:hypothetical protein